MTNTEVVIEKTDWGYCSICGGQCQLEKPAIYGNPMQGVYRGKTHIRLYRICENCRHYDEASVNADYEGRRFTAIGTGINHDALNQLRCHCGAVTHAVIGHCISCSKDIRMLNKQQREAKLLSQVLTNLRRELKTQIKDKSTA